MGPSSHCHRKLYTVFKGGGGSGCAPSRLPDQPPGGWGRGIRSRLARAFAFACGSLGHSPLLAACSGIRLCSHPVRGRPLGASSSPALSGLVRALGALALAYPPKPALQRTLKTAQGKLTSNQYCLDQALDRLVSTSSTRYRAFTADLSTLWSARGLTCLCSGNLLLQVGFTLRCLQRLSHPHFASQQCRWRDNCYTRGASIPVLSY